MLLLPYFSFLLALRCNAYGLRGKRKGAWLSSQLPLLRELQWDEDKQYKTAANIKPMQAADRIGQVLGSVAFQLPYSAELEEQYLAGNLLDDLSMKDSRAFRKEIYRICKEVF